MAPILGIFASSALAAANATSYESIATVTVGSGGSSSVTFSSIPGTYAHLQIRGIGRSTKASGTDYAQLTFNSSGGTAYATHYLYGNGTSALATGFTSAAFIYQDFYTSAGASASIFTSNIIDILDYANTNKNTTVRMLNGSDNNGSGNIALQSGLWNNTAAITSITLTMAGGNFVQYSHFALYGIKGA